MHPVIRERLGRMLKEVLVELQGGIRAFDKIGFRANKQNAITNFMKMIEMKIMTGYQTVFKDVKGNTPLNDSLLLIIKELENELKSASRKMITKFDFQALLLILKKTERKLFNIGLQYIGKDWLSK